SDQLRISGLATLAGTLNVNLINSFTPSAGNTFPLLTFGSRSGTFGTINGLTQGGTTFTPVYDSGDFTLLASAWDLWTPEDLPFDSDGGPARPARPETAVAVATPPAPKRPALAFAADKELPAWLADLDTEVQDVVFREMSPEAGGEMLAGS